MNEIDLAKRNARMLLELHPAVGVKVAAVLIDLQGHGWRPRIQQALRTQSEQLENLSKGVSRVRFSYHMVGLAADLLDDDNPVGKDAAAETRFCLMLASSAWAHGLDTGTLWGLSVEDRAKATAIIAAKKWTAGVELGWDAGHVQVRGITLSEAKRGVRPGLVTSV